jgi:hypothetical protein
MIKKIIGLFLIGLTTSANSNNFMTGDKLYLLMTGNSLSQLESINYIMGVSDTILPVLCPPGPVTVKQVFDLTKKTLEKFDKDRNKNASDFVIIGLNQEFPCKNKNPPKDNSFEDRNRRPKPQLLI